MSEIKVTRGKNSNRFSFTVTRDGDEEKEVKCLTLAETIQILTKIGEDFPFLLEKPFFHQEFGQITETEDIEIDITGEWTCA